MAETRSGRRRWLTRERVVLAALLAFAVVVRGGVLFAMREKLVDDPDAYRRIAENLLAHGAYSLDEPEEPFVPSTGVVTPNPQKAPWKTPTAYRPPLYPVVLSNLAAADQVHVSLAKVAGLHLLLGVVTVWLTWGTARRLQIGNCKLQIANWGSGGPAPAASGGRKSPEVEPPTEAASWWAQPTLLGPLVAGVIVACDPILLNQSALVMTETLAAFLAVLSLWCLARFDGQRSWFNAGLAGGAMGLAVLCRPTFLPWVGLVAGGMLVVRGRIADFKLQNANCKFAWADVGWRVANCAALVVVAGMVVSPWVIRNQRVFGKPIVTTTHGGYTLFLGNNSSFFDYLMSDKSGVPWSAKDLPAVLMNYDFDGTIELKEDRSFVDAAWSTIQENRRAFVWACGYRLGQLWSPLPNRLTAEESLGRRVVRYAVAGWYGGVYLLAAVGIWRLRWRVIQPPWVWGVLLCLVFTGVHTFYWSNLRMRAPLMPFVACLAGAAFLAREKQPRMGADERG